MLSQYFLILNLFTVYILFDILIEVKNYDRVRRQWRPKVKWIAGLIMLMPLAYTICKLCSYLKPTDLSNETTRIFYKLQLMNQALIYLIIAYYLANRLD